jgi:hypothetical protein
MKNKNITAFVARNEDGTLNLFMGVKPYKCNIYGNGYWAIPYKIEDGYIEEIQNDNFPQVKWGDKEPTKVELTIKISK